MNLLYIQLSEKQPKRFGIPKQYLNEVENGFDLDNFSDSDVVNSAIQFLQMPNLHLIIEAEPAANISKLMHILTEIRNLENKSLEFIGEHRMKGYLYAG